MKIIIADEIFDKTMFYQDWYNGETFGGQIVDVDDQYRDCVREDFDGYVFNVDKYNTRKSYAETQKKIPFIKKRLDELTQDFIQVLCGADFGTYINENGKSIDVIQERKQEFQTLHNELRLLQGKEPRKYE